MFCSIIQFFFKDSYNIVNMIATKPFFLKSYKT